MAETESSADNATAPNASAPDAPVATGARRRIAALVEWGKQSRLRMALGGCLAVVVLGGIFAAWSYLAHLAVRHQEPVSLDMALAALDDGNYEEAKSLIARMQSQADASLDLGGALFVLGAAKAQQADAEWSADRQRAMHLVAARYLRKARALGVPGDRERQSQFFLGRSLTRANQPQPGIAELKDLLANNDPDALEIHALLTDAYLALPDPDLDAALEHNRQLLEQDSLDPSRRDDAGIDQVEILGRLGRLEEAAQQLDSFAGKTSQQARAKSLSGQLALQAALKLPADSDERKTLIDRALADLRESDRLDPLSGELTREAMVWIGKCYEAQGDQAAAIQRYDTLGQLFGDSSEGLVAALSKAQMLQSSGNAKQALAEYRRVLDAFGQRVTYANRLLPLSSLRKQLLSAHLNFVEKQQFEHAIALVDQFSPVFELVEVTELRGRAYKQWGLSQLAAADDANLSDADPLWKQGRYHLRAAGRAYDSLARLRFATRDFTEDLWSAADLYFQGHSFSHAARVLDEYLHHEATRHKAMALLRLGQCQLARGQVAEATATLEECIEMHPRDPAVYQARLECASAYQQSGDEARARQLLITNLTGDTMSPSSIQWRDSLFALGDFLHNAGQFAKAIAKLDEAVTRYPNAPQALLARYSIARSFHRAADEPAKKAREAKTENERQKNRRLRDQNLEAALEKYLSVQRLITLEGRGDDGELERTLLRNCYMMQGSVLFQLRRYQEARKAFANVAGLYQDEPFVLESFVHTANCWRRLNQPVNARQTIEQAKLVLSRFPAETDFRVATNFNRQQWQLLLNEMSRW